jgi:outer membrane protein OmpA-like peptidoglycan-associated protein
MRHRVLKLVSALAGCVPLLALAQQPPAPEPESGPSRNWSRELTVGAGGTYLDQQLIAQVNVTDPSASRIAWGGVVSVGVNLGQMFNLSIGTFAGYTTPATVIQPFAALGWTPNINWAVSPFLSVGAGVTTVRWRSYRVTSRYAAHVGAGFRMMLGQRLALRLEAREQYEKYRDSTAFPNAVFNGTGSVGLSWFIGGGGSLRDSDGDGVADRDDRCPDTPRGATVDAQGCPSDSDSDGVADGLDRCPDTPSGVTVDAQGCPADSDGDGVADYLDKCPDTPSGVQVDTAGDRAGCPADSDGDGVPDLQDRCPNTPTAARPVDANGCPVDSDSDGVADYRDRCPNTPAAARPVDTNGCPVDSDGDGVPDYRDRCLGTAPNTRVDGSGCPTAVAAPPPRPVEAGGRAYPLPDVNASRVLGGVTFRGQAVLTPAARSELNLVADAIMATPNSRWEVGGYWDNRGAPARTRRMTQLRAAAVRAYLVGRGVPSASIIAVGYGSRNPVADNTILRGRARNRRVEIRRLQ